MNIRPDSALHACRSFSHSFMRSTLLLSLTVVVSACAVNPVTGDREVQFYDTQWELTTGNSLYAPMRQQQGGDFVADPELQAYVQSIGQHLAHRARRKDELDFEFHVINNSTPNAWALPGGKIAINRGLLTELKSEAELAAVLGHEIVHADASHSAQQQSKATLTRVGAIASMVLLGSQADSSAGRAAAVMVPALGAQLLSQKYSRDAEREADDYGMRYMSESGFDPNGAIQLQETFVELSKDRRQDWLSGFFASHPPSQERVQRNRETAQSLPSGGIIGEDRYQQKLAYLRELEPAYAAYDSARELVVKKDLGGARTKLDKALAITPDEALFQVLDGDLKQQAGQLEQAYAAYDLAMELNPGYFLPHLRRGRLNYEQGNTPAAATDLRNSLERLPTALAHYLLGNIERDAGQTDRAVAHYTQAASSDSDVGRAAQRELAKIRSSSVR